MASAYYYLTLLSSLVIRLSTFVFLRWIPGHHFPPIILGSFLTYLYSFYKTAAESRDTSDAKDIGNVRPNVPEHAIADTPDSDDDVPVDIVIIEDLVVIPGDPHPAVHLLTGLPTARSAWNWVILATQVLCVLMTQDLVYHGPLLYPSRDLSFTRVGYVSHDQARILIREPDPDQIPLFVSYKSLERPEQEKTVAKVYSLDEAMDYTISVNITSLRPSTRYAYSVSNGQSGEFETSARPRDDTGKLNFVTSSCIKPRFPYSIFDHPLRIRGLEILSEWLPSLKPAFMLFLGDFIYIDVPRRLGSRAETYRAEYRRTYASPSWTKETRSLPWIHVIDDHEIANDWDLGWEAPYPAAVDPWNLYHHSVNPPHYGNTSYYQFTRGPASFFLLDTRRYRTPVFDKPHTDATKTMLGSEQLQDVLAWLSKPEPAEIRWKILVSSVPFTRNWRVNAQDTWSGYLAERQTILETMWDVSSKPLGPGIVVLSGDRHEFSATSFPAPSTGRWPSGVKVTELSCSPLNMFYLPVRSYREVSGEQSGVGHGGEDVNLAYIPDGNVKFGAVEIENGIGTGQSTLKYRTIIDGVERWSHVLTTLDDKGRSRAAVWG